ncbi:hypothetical protein H6F88_09910 [Oculatella sp. FACHB-28]|uniref:hypothetical protein n=1 Tax=Oculatella sp. FACHB-28 TaxID=2692845 RepID=UPI00168548F3|nr:hypothetical protein [Oculatella sp. FACHB-28]MBD2056330.1 hypothetical protein [Oculatella sp. FACHB-28]
MPENFLESLCSVVAESNLSSAHPERERLQILVIGSRDGVMETIHTLHARGFAQVGAWSPLLPAPHLSEVMSILRRYRKRDN